MKPLREWSARRTLVASLVWLVGLPILVSPAMFGAVGWLARAERERVANAARDSIVPGLRVDYTSSSAGDVLHSFGDRGSVLILAMFLLPPIALWLAWLLARRQQRSGGSHDPVRP